ncbi:MAG: hypothetical protein H6674_10095 [Dehalococcoidia bacterium]|nr:hypothetical protein [Dehalococcoidia bacterium]
MDESSAIFDVELGHFGARLAPVSLEAFAKWLDDEESAWAWLREGKAANRGETNHLLDPLKNSLRHFREQIAIARKHREEGHPSHLTDCLTRLGESVRSAYQASLIASTSPLHPLLRHYADAQRWPQFTGVLYMGTRQRLDPGDPQHFEGMMAACRAVGGEDAVLSTCRSGEAERVAAKLAQRAAECSAVLDDLEAKREQFDSRATDSLQKGARAQAKFIRQARNRMSSQRSTFDEEWQRLQATYDTALALQEPVSYWRQRSAQSLRLARFMYAAFGASLVVATVLGLRYGSALPWEQLVKADGTWSLGGAAIVLAAIGLAVALLRIPLRLGASFLHLPYVPT